MRRPLVLAAVAALTLPVVAASPAAAAPQDLVRTVVPVTAISSFATASNCPAVVVYVSRGSSENVGESAAHPESGQTSKYYAGVGEELTPVVNSIRSLYPATAVKTVVATNAVRPAVVAGSTTYPQAPAYTAVGVDWNTSPVPIGGYVNSLVAGAERVQKDLDLIRRQCTNARIVAVGFSMGADVNRRAQAALGPTWVPTAGRAVTLAFGDPNWLPAESWVRYSGDVATDHKGLMRAVAAGELFVSGGVLPAIPAQRQTWNVQTWCHGGDPSCQWPNPSLAAHLDYDTTDHYGGATRAARALTGVSANQPLPTVEIATTTLSCIPSSFGTIPVALSMVGSPAGSGTKTFQTIWEPFDFAPANTTTVSAGGTTTISITRPGIRLKTLVHGKKMDYKNTC